MVVASMALVAMLGCRHDGSLLIATRPDPNNARASGSIVAPKCQVLPNTCRRKDQPPLKARLVDCPSPRNSDGTLKCLPPPPPNEPGHTLLFSYWDFGVQAMAGRLLGHSWWRWEGGGSFEACDEFDVRVVVFHDRTVREVTAKYPTIKGKSDYRIVSRESALRFIEEVLAELTPGEYIETRRLLEHTRSMILDCLPIKLTDSRLF
jgi:hypothetical protein